jgi:lyso-ornithine lipid O-acyltransferase
MFRAISYTIAAIRLLVVVLLTLWTVLQVTVVSLFPGDNLQLCLQLRRKWARRLLWVMGFRVTVVGKVPDFPCIIMCNHRAGIDPLVILRDVLAWPVSKAEVEQWPFLGYGAKRSGIIFLQRESLTSRKQTLQAIADKVKEGWPVILFPEGTTHKTPLSGPFKKGSFQLAADEGLTIVPAALIFGSTEDYWVGNQSFISHFFLRFGTWRMTVTIQYGPALQHSDAQQLLQDTKDWIDEQLPVRATLAVAPDNDPSGRP